MNKILFLTTIIITIYQIRILNAQTLSFTEVAQSLKIQHHDYAEKSACWGDFDNDGDIDLYVISTGYAITGPQPLNDLFRNDVNINGTFTDVANQWGVDEAEGASWAGTWCDVNNDGLLDLHVCNYSDFISPVESKLFINTGTIFDDQTIAYNVSNPGHSMASCWGDYDNDGDQDLFVTVSDHTSLTKLFRNDGGYFTDVTDIYNIEGAYNTQVGNWVDYDNDGDLDLYQFIASNENRLYENKIDENNTFVDVAPFYGINDPDGRGGVLWFDYDNDEDLDIIIMNHIGHSNDPSTKIYRNDVNNNNSFTDVSILLGFPDSLSSRAGTIGDYDLDGDLDIYLCDRYKANMFFRNDYNISGSFIEEGASLNIADDLAGGGVLSGDYDNDGDLDIYVINLDNEPSRMYRNEMNSDNYLFIRLTDKNGSFNRFGSNVKVYFAGTDSLAGMRVVDGGGSGGKTQDQYDCHFGINPNLAYDIEVIFTTRTNGQNHIFNKYNRPILGNYIPSQNGHFLEVRDSVVTVTSIIPVNKPNIVESFRLYQNYPNPFNSSTTISFDLPKFSEVEIIIYDALGKKVKTLMKTEMKAGTHQKTWDGKDSFGRYVSSGVYFYSFTAKALDMSKELFSKSSKLLLLR